MLYVSICWRVVIWYDVCVCVGMYVYIHTYLCTYTNTNTHSLSLARADTHKHTPSRACVRTNTRVCIEWMAASDSSASQAPYDMNACLRMTCMYVCMYASSQGAFPRWKWANDAACKRLQWPACLEVCTRERENEREREKGKSTGAVKETEKVTETMTATGTETETNTETHALSRTQACV